MSQYTTLFVDDEPFILKALQRLFRGVPFRILTCSSAQEALEVMKKESVQLLVTDNIMPGMSGVELVKKVREMRPEILRIILSGQSDIDAVLKAVNEGEAYRFILKPWNDMDLKVTVNLALAQYKLEADNRQLVSQLKSQSELLEILQQRDPAGFADVVKRLRRADGPDRVAPESAETQRKEPVSCLKQ